jgi:hypothetical protein
LEAPPAGALQWPPTKEDLERLYLFEKLSASKIAKVYRLSYPNPKTAESTVLYHLKRNGISRRDPAAHNRIATESVVDEWVRRYAAGESLKQIAGSQLSPATVFHHLKKRGVELRDKVEAQIKAVSKHERKPFTGDEGEKAYLLGFSTGDLYVTKHGRAIRVKTASTHPAMEHLFRTCFERHGPVYLLPKTTPFAGYEWTYTADLDVSFCFLLETEEKIPNWIKRSRKLSMGYLSGFFDAEGSAFMNSRGWFELSITNSNLKLLTDVGQVLTRDHINGKISSPTPSPLGLHHIVWHFRVWDREDVRALASALQPRHSERISKLELVREIYDRPSREGRNLVHGKWKALQDSIEVDRLRYINQAKEEYLRRRNLGPVQN